jgi:PEP-CTERM motif
MKKMILLSLFLAMFIPVSAGAVLIDPKFAVDPASPSINGNITPDDVLVSGPALHTPGTALGLIDDFFSGVFDNLNALSYGQDPIKNPLYFSVDRVAVGLPGSDVNAQAQPGVEEAAGDVYRTLPPSGDNKLVIDEQQLGLIPGFFGDDLDALELDSEPMPFTYFSVDFLSPTGDFTDILISTGNGIFGTFADGESDIGLDPLDDLDALVLLDRGTIGELDRGLDLALFSISTFSPNALIFGGSFSPADILFTDFTGNFSVWASASDIGLGQYDEVNAVDTVIPEPSTLFLMASGLGALLLGKLHLRGKPA